MKTDLAAPIILWGPYLWADGVKGREGDKLVYTREDLAADGTHPRPHLAARKSPSCCWTFSRPPRARNRGLPRAEAGDMPTPLRSAALT